MPPEALEMNIPEYAEHRGVSRQAIGKLVRDERIPFRRDGRSVIIDVAAADRALGETRERIVTRGDLQGDDGVSSARLTKAKTATETYRARLAQLDYDERVGKLIPVEQLTEAAVVAAEQVVLIMNSLVHRAPQLLAASKKGESGVRAALKEIVREMRASTAKEFEKLPLTAKQKKSAEETQQ